MSRTVSFTLFLLCASPAFAEQKWLTPDEFEARVSGRSAQVLDENKQVFGTEYFLEERKVLWQRTGESRCYAGTWAVRDKQICFSFETGIGNCFRYYLDGDKLVSIDFVAGVQTTTVRDILLVSQPLPNCSLK